MRKLVAPPAKPKATSTKVDLPKDLQDAVRVLIWKLEESNRLARQEEVKRVQRQRRFFRGDQNIFYHELASRWARVTEAGLGLPSQVPEGAVRYDYVENLYRVECIMHIAMLRENPPGVQYRPQNFDQPEDVATANAAKTVGEFVVQNNQLETAMADPIWYLDHDGRCLSYTYWEESKDLYGSSTFQDFETSEETVPGKIVCEACGYEAPAMPPDGVCETCLQQGIARPMTEVPPEVVPVDIPKGEPYEEARGQERAIFMGALETNLPFYARDLRSCGWLTWEVEMDRALIRSMYPDLDDKSLELSGTTDSGDAEEARQARIALSAASYGNATADEHSDLLTFRRTWIRPWQFYSIRDKDQVQQLVSLFPNGCKVAFAGATFCEAFNEPIEKCWWMEQAFPGDGMMRDGWLTDYVDTQRKINTGENIKFEIFERGMGVTVVDGKMLDGDAYNDAGSIAGAVFEVERRPGEKASDAISHTEPVPVSEQLIRDLDSMRGPRSEKLTGNFAAAFGGDTGSNDTARGIAEVKDSAKGRMAYYKAIVNKLYAGTVMNLIRCFVEHREDDVKFAIEGPSGQLDAKTIRLDELRGNFYVYTEPEDAYPVSPAEKRATITNIINGGNPELSAILMVPENYDLIRWALGADIKLPGEQARRKQMREIERMKAGEYVQVDMMLDQHDYEIGAMNEWASSEDGQAAAPEVRQLVAQHMVDHLKAKGAVAKVVAETDPNAQANADAAAAAGPVAVPAEEAA